MPALPDVPKVVRTSLTGIISGGGVWAVRFYTQYTGTAPAHSDLTSFNATLSTAYGTNLKSLHGNDTELTQLESVDLTSATGAVDITAAAIAGTRAGTYIPGAAAAVTSYTISRRYRGGHPRGYWPFGMTADVANPDTWAGAFVTAVNTGVNAWFTAVAAAGWAGAGTLTHVNVSYYKGFTVVVNPTTGRARNVPTLRVTPVVDLITASHCQNSIGTQRRRGNFLD